MSLLSTYRLIASHPLTRANKSAALIRWLRWQIGSRVLGWPVAVPFVEKTRLLAKTGMTAATGNIYCGLREPEDMGFVLHFLRPGDLFVDIGANIGSDTILASAAKANVISFEPVPTTFGTLLDNVHLNRLEKTVDARNEAVGRSNGEPEIIADPDTTNQVLVGASLYTGTSVRVPVVTLDSALQGRTPRLIRIDVESFETEVLDGTKATLEHPALAAVLGELNGSGAPYGFDEDGLHRDTLYRRDADAIQATLNRAPRRAVLGAAL